MHAVDVTSASVTGTNSGSRKEHSAGAVSAASQSRSWHASTTDHRGNRGGDSAQGERLRDGDLWPGATDHGENRGPDHWHDGSDNPSHEPLMTHSCESSRAGGGCRGRRESRLPGDPAHVNESQ